MTPSPDRAQFPGEQGTAIVGIRTGDSTRAHIPRATANQSEPSRFDRAAAGLHLPPRFRLIRKIDMLQLVLVLADARCRNAIKMGHSHAKS